MTTQQAVQRIAKMPPKKLTLAAAKKWIAMLEDELKAGDALRANTWEALTKAEERVAHLEVQLENEKAYSAHLRTTAEETHRTNLELSADRDGLSNEILGLRQNLIRAEAPKPFLARLRALFFP